MGENDVKQPKPAPDMALEILKRLKIDKENAVVVGDAVTDIRMGLNAGLKASIAVLTGLSSEAELRQITDYVVPSIAAIGVEKAK
jgi:AHBA synthesis associated protein